MRKFQQIEEKELESRQDKKKKASPCYQTLEQEFQKPRAEKKGNYQ